MVNQTGLEERKYQYGFITDVESDAIPVGLNTETVKQISGKKSEPHWMLEWRLASFESWQKMKEPKWARVQYPPIDYQNISYYSAPKKPKNLKNNKI